MTLKIPVRLGRSKPVRRENDIQREVLEALRKMGKFALRLNSGKVKVRGGYVQLCPVGTPDLLVIDGVLTLDGFFQRVIWIELKQPKSGQQSDAQKHFQREATRRGERYLLARSLSEVIKNFEPKIPKLVEAVEGDW